VQLIDEEELATRTYNHWRLWHIREQRHGFSRKILRSD
jgi:hypothetical protein